jgi:hypothetical protein
MILVAVLGTPMLMKSRREARYRSAMSGLKTLVAAEGDFRANDRDGNGINDFWTGDVSGLSTLRSPNDGQEIRIVFAAQARADARPILPLGSPAEAKDEYFFQALDRDIACRNEPDWVYRQDTDGSGLKVHNRSRFGFCAFPEGARGGRAIFIVNENGTIFHRMDGHLHFNWPDDPELKDSYTRFDD